MPAELQSLQSWWENLSPELRGYLMHGALALGALLGGQIVGAVVARVLRGRSFDSLFRVTTPVPGHVEDGRGFTATWLVGLLVRLSVWAAAGSWFAREYGQAELAATLTQVTGKTWAVAGTLTGALALAGFLARRVIECLEGGTAAAPAVAGRNGPPPARSLAGPVAAGVYGLVLILTLLAVADSFDLPLIRTAVTSLWQLALNLLIAGAALLIGGLGARWAQAASTPQAAASSPERVGQYTAIGIVGGTTAVAVGMLLFTVGLGIGVAVVAVACVGVYFAQRHSADLVAGLRLRMNKVTEVHKDGVAWQITRVGLLNSEVVGRRGENFAVQNRHLLEASASTPGTPSHPRHSVAAH